MNKTAKKILYIGISLIIIALLLLIYFEWEEIYSKKESNDIMKTILNNKDNNKNEDEIVIDDLKYIGYIVIPTLDLNLPISKEFSYSSLKKSPTLYYGSLMNNNMVICGHSYKSHFRYLYKLKQGDEVIFVDRYDFIKSQSLLDILLTRDAIILVDCKHDCELSKLAKNARIILEKDKVIIV